MLQKQYANKRLNEYMTLEELDNGLLVSITEEGRRFLKENKEDDYFANFEEIFESIKVNSEWEFHRDLGESGFGLTSAEGFTDGYHLSDVGGDYEGDGNLYYNNNYATINFIDELIENGYYKFNKG